MCKKSDIMQIVFSVDDWVVYFDQVSQRASEHILVTLKYGVIFKKQNKTCNSKKKKMALFKAALHK